MERVFVFGSNLGGRHGAGSAKAAMQEWGAIWGQGVGRQGDSYAIPTKNANFDVMPLEEIEPYVKEFLKYAAENDHIKFSVVAIGCGYAGYTPEQIAPMFRGATSNVFLPLSFIKVLNDSV